MPSQLRLRAMAAGTVRRSSSPPVRPAGLALTHAQAPPPSMDSRSAMLAIQASLDRLYNNSDVDLEDSNASHDSSSSLPTRPPKRSRLESPTAHLDSFPVAQPPSASVDKRDGRTKIYINGYEYTRANITRVKISYRCSFYRSQACPAKLEFYAATMDYDFLNMVAHTCTPPSRAPPPLDESSKTLIVKAAMQREVDALATSTADTPQEIWDVVSTHFYQRSDNVVVRGLNKAQVTKRVHRTRAEHFGSEIHGRVEVPPLSRVKQTSLNFFQFHHVWSNPAIKKENKIDRVIGWAHPALLSLLRYGKVSLFVDGTFRCVPTHFRQCIVVMVFDQGTKLYVPVFYVLAASKTYEAYWNVLQYVSDACGQRIDAEQVVCDFESALIKAVQDWFPETPIVGCFFHFKQACSRRMAKLRIPKAEIKIAMERGVLDMLTVLDPTKIPKQGIAWVRSRVKERCTEEGIAHSASKWTKFWMYFRKTWLELLPPSNWNVHGIRRDVVARTNNPLERFNRELNASFGAPHPSVVRFVHTIEAISRRYVKLRDDIARGVATAPRRETQPELPAPTPLPENYESDEEDGSAGDVNEDEDDGGEGSSGEEEDGIVSDNGDFAVTI